MKKAVCEKKKLEQIKNRLDYPTIEFEFGKSCEWANNLKQYALEHQQEGKSMDYVCDKLLNIACDGFLVQRIQKKDMSWEYLFECMKLCRYHFNIFMPEVTDTYVEKMDDDGFKRVQAWYDEEKDAIQIKAYTGKWEEEEDTAPGYDGYGRYDTYYEYVYGTITKAGTWIDEPHTQWLSHWEG